MKQESPCLIESPEGFWPAPAKLNLFLHVTGRRADGYHTLQTLFQLIDLADEVRIQCLDTPDIRRGSEDYGVAEHEDLVIRAAKLLQSQCKAEQGALISVRKNIPLGAGLGGGSSDAATTLLVLNRLWDCGLSLEQLAQIGVKLGADIPVFIHGTSAFASGIGDELQPVELGDRHYVLVFNSFGISTGRVFQHPRLERSTAPVTLQQALAGKNNNDCEPVVCELFPGFEKMLKDLEKWGEPHMTGTGSCVFLPMPEKKAAISAARAMKCRYNVRAVRGLDRSPTHEILGLTARSNRSLST